MKLSVIVPCWNAAPTIEDVFRGLLDQAWPDEWEVIIADNGSTDDLPHVVARYKGQLPGLRIVDASARRGAAHARNVGVKAATGEGMLFCDADDIPGSGWAAAMESALRRYEFVACRLDFEQLNPPSLRTARQHTQATALQQFRFLPFPHAGAGTLGITRVLHEAVGGFDEAIPICEDVDYCMRIQQRGTQLTFVPEAVLHCRLRGSARGAYIQASRYAEYEVFLYKRYGMRSSSEWWRWRQYGHAWRFLLMRVPELLRTPEGKAMLWWRLGRLMGSLKGSLRFGAPPAMVE